jgi:hypothetical protein
MMIVDLVLYKMSDVCELKVICGGDSHCAIMYVPPMAFTTA